VTINLARMRIQQVAMVVADLEATMATYHRTMGWGPWNIYQYEKPRFHDAQVRGKAAEFTYIGAETLVGDMWIELLQPLSGQSPLHEWLDIHGDGGLHHLGYGAGSMDEARTLKRDFEAAGSTVLMEGWIDRIYFFYMDTRPTILEVWAGDIDQLAPNRVYP
jgi:methylmalonyl-CoA/ethylmalonyl-CoA epimerase